MYPKEGKEQLFQQLQSIGWSQSALERVFTGLNNEQGKTLTEEYFLFLLRIFQFESIFVKER